MSKKKTAKVNKNKEKTNPLTKMNPISQANLMKSNIDEINKNLMDTIQILYKITNSLNLSNSPCEVAKFVTNKVCTMKDDFGGLSNLMSIVSLDKIKQFANKSLDISKNILESSTDPTQIGDKLSTLVNNTSNIAKEMNVMKGGSYLKNSYKYITNPLTGRKVLANGKLGKKIILYYIKNYY